MLNIFSLNNTIDALIPITRFNRGEANKIFDEVKESGCKIVVKNNTPTCILLTPEKYREMTEIIEDQYLLALAEEREQNDTGVTIPSEEIYKELGIDSDELNDISMVYGVDFE